MIKDILISQKNELFEKFKEKYVARNISLTNLDNNLIKVISGPRRCGKSFFAIHELKKRIGNFGYVNFDDERLLKYENYDEIILNVKSIYGNPKYIFFDEIQNLKSWELFLNRLQRQGLNIIVSGSNSKLLSNELATHFLFHFRNTFLSILPS
jgi:predicted AAA+ superfamily ATPase